MQPAKGQHKRIASALALAITVAVVAMIASTAFGQTRFTNPQPPGPKQAACTARSCALSSKTSASSISVVPTQVPAGTTPSFTAPTSNPAQGMLHSQGRTGMLNCGGYRAIDPISFQFYLGGTFRGNIAYKVTYTLSNPKHADLQFCLGATFKFTTLSGKQARPVTLPNGLPGFAGLIPGCTPASDAPCLVSKSPAAKGSRDVVLKVLIPAVDGSDPWGRA